MLENAVANRDSAATQHAIEIGADVEVRNRKGRTPIHTAAYRGDARIVQVLISAGADFDAQESDGLTQLTPLHLAEEGNHPEIVRQLLNAGANRDARSCRGRTPLTYAVFHEHTEIVRIFLESGADAKSCDPEGVPILRHAVCNGDTETVRVLLEHGADANFCESGNVSILHAAASRGIPEIVRLLISSGANPNAKSKDQKTPLHQAVEKGRTESIELLLDNGADINAVDGSGRTPLHICALAPNKCVAKILLDHGADVQIKSANGETALLMAARNGAEATVEMLLSKGANTNPRDEYGNNWQKLLSISDFCSPTHGDCWSYSDKASAVKAFITLVSHLPHVLIKHQVPAHSSFEVCMWRSTVNDAHTLVLTGSNYLPETDPVAAPGQAIRYTAFHRTRKEIYDSLKSRGGYKVMDKSSFQCLLSNASVQLVMHSTVVSKFKSANPEIEKRAWEDPSEQSLRRAALRAAKIHQDSFSD